MKHLLALVLITAAYTASAQNKTASSETYKTAIGIKLWNGAGANLKTFIADKSAIEVVGFFYNRGTRITGLYEWHGDLNTEGNLKWYVGGGGHATIYKGYTGLGLDGVLGIDFKLPNAPLNFALDWQPAFELGSGSFNGFYGNWGGFAIRYTL
ncbi:MAG: hypothetical protein K2X48_05300 [Chitinophagaceae bacterium]|nr:hypothetical protein [Chitinophagaceae bacterium]